MKSAISVAALAAAVFIISPSCDREGKFKIEGDVYGGEGKTLVLAKADFSGRWIAVDSTTIGKNGDFSIQVPSPASPEIYSLALGNRVIYIPVDSIETIKVETVADKFGTDFKLSGSSKAEQMTAFEKDLAAYKPADEAAADAFKRTVYTKYIMDSQGSIMSYYVLTKVVDGKPLYDASNPTDAKYYAAVATQFEQYRPQDPHGKMVREVSLAAMRKHNADKGNRRVIHAQEKTVMEIELPDVNGNVRKLSDYIGKGHPTVVVFGVMNDEKSPAFNRELAALQSRLGGALTIYDVSVDQDQYAWRDAARNLPWINVFDAGGMTSDALRDYNVRVLPSFYIYNAAGELVDSAFSLEELNKKL